MTGTTLTVLVPAHNEEEGIADTLEALERQTVRPDEVIVVADNCSDRTEEIARSHGVTVRVASAGSKARAQNSALPHIRTDLVLPVDADTVLSDDYVELIKAPFAESDVAIAAGCVLTRHQSTVWERGRQIEYLFGFHWFRPVQNWANSPVVCSGCCSTFRTQEVIDFGGFPERTMVEDIDYTWSKQIEGRRAVYVHNAVAYAEEPTSLHFMRTQLRRWKHGYMQNIRLHGREMVAKKKMLALWVSLSFVEVVISPLMILLPLLWVLVDQKPLLTILAMWGIGEAFLMIPPLTIACFKRRLNPFKVLRSYPAYWVLKPLNFVYDIRAVVVELMLVPLGLSQGMQVYQKGH